MKHSKNRRVPEAVESSIYLGALEVKNLGFYFRVQNCRVCVSN